MSKGLRKTDDGRYFCDAEGCDATYKNTKDLMEHRKAEHLGYKFGCSACGIIWKKRNLLSRHPNPKCKNEKGVILELRPGDGIYSQGECYTGTVHSELIEWVNEAQKAQTQPSTSEAEVQPSSSEVQAQPIVPPGYGLVPLAILNIGPETPSIHCGSCIVDGNYLEFPSEMELVRHKMNHHLSFEERAALLEL